MCLAQGPQRSDAGEARTRGPSVSSQALYHWATALPKYSTVILHLGGLYYCYFFYLTERITKHLRKQNNLPTADKKYIHTSKPFHTMWVVIRDIYIALPQIVYVYLQYMS